MNLYIHFNTQTLPSDISKLRFRDKEQLISVAVVANKDSLLTPYFDINNNVIYEGMTVKGINNLKGESRVFFDKYNFIQPFYYLQNYSDFIITSFVKRYEHFYISNEFDIDYAFQNTNKLMLELFNHLKIREVDDFTDYFHIHSLKLLIKKYGLKINDFEIGIKDSILKVLSGYYGVINPSTSVNTEMFGKIENQLNIYTNNVDWIDKLELKDNINFNINSVNYFNPVSQSVLSIDVAREYKKIHNEIK